MVPIGVHHWLGFGGGHLRRMTPPPPPPDRQYLGRNSAPPGSFREIFGSSEARSHCATFVLSQLPMVRPPAAAIRDLLVLRGLRDSEKFRGPVQGPKRAKNSKKWIFPVLGAVLGETPADQICLRAKCGPSEPCLGSHVSLGPGIWPFGGGAGGRFVGWGLVLSVGNPTSKKPFQP